MFDIIEWNNKTNQAEKYINIQHSVNKKIINSHVGNKFPPTLEINSHPRWK